MNFKVLLLTSFICFCALSSSDQVFKNIAENQTLPLSERIRYWSERFIGTPYDSAGPLGEGESGRFDRDPLFRFDVFDCTTFVETVTALSLSRDKEDFLDYMNEIRYQDGTPSYLSRNHIISRSWIPLNLRKGFYSDENIVFPGFMRKKAEGIIDFPNWLRFHRLDSLKLPLAPLSEKKERLEELKAMAELYTKEAVELNYLSLKEILENWETFQEIAQGPYVLSVVRPNWKIDHLIGTNLHVSHQGIVVKEENSLFFIHASSEGEVLKVSLRNYLKKYKDHESVKGAHLLKIQ